MSRSGVGAVLWLDPRIAACTALISSFGDDHRGLVKAAQRHVQGVTWQRCQAHFTRNIAAAAPQALHAADLLCRSARS